ncbi:invasion associated locus B family protein [Chelativorans sp.]|uniref:invasion associated locus B family protein n=1 Tax=Chelativorans sp. TaxID=2203393 RepID=UPI0028120B52|nr:invasion associated locus B family protein [Chelativorans sp.]
MKKTSLIDLALPTFAGALMITSVAAQEAVQVQTPTTLSETYDSWTVQCANRSEGEQTRRVCQMSQELLQQESRQRVLLFAISKEGENAAKATVIAPFGLMLSEGLRIEINETELVRGAYRTCLPAGCVVEFDLPEAAIDQLGAAEAATVFMTANTGQPVTTDISMKGFSAAYQRLVALSAG